MNLQETNPQQKSYSQILKSVPRPTKFVEIRLYWESPSPQKKTKTPIP